MVEGSSLPRSPPSSDVASTDFWRASTPKSAPFSSSARTRAASSAEFNTRIRKGIPVEVCCWPGAKTTKARRQNSTRDIDTLIVRKYYHEMRVTLTSATSDRKAGIALNDLLAQHRPLARFPERCRVDDPVAKRTAIGMIAARDRETNSFHRQ